MRQKRNNGTAKAKAILTALGLFMGILFVGCGLANVTYVGFILMGVGGGGFILVIVLLVIVDVLTRRAGGKASNNANPLEEKLRLKMGKVVRCELYKQNVSDVRERDDYDMLFRVWVETEQNGKTVIRRFVSPKRFMSGVNVFICGNPKKPKSCELTELEDKEVAS